MTETHCFGWKLEFTKKVSKGAFVELCCEFAKELNLLHSITERDDLIRVEPLRRIEGGWQIFGGPGGVYDFPSNKSVVTTLGWYPGWRTLEWPHVPQNVLEEWKDLGECLIPEKHTGTTILKASGGAPLWTVEELQAFEKVFEKFGIRVGQRPKKSMLVVRNSKNAHCT